MRMAFAAGLALWASLASGCKGSASDKPTREACTRVSEHIADLIIAHNVGNPEQWWDDMHAAGGETGIGGSVTRETFKAFLDTPEGKTWLLQRRGNTLTGTQAAIDGCVENATTAQVACLLAAKSKDDVIACDDKRKAGGATDPAESK